MGTDVFKRESFSAMRDARRTSHASRLAAASPSGRIRALPAGFLLMRCRSESRERMGRGCGEAGRRPLRLRALGKGRAPLAGIGGAERRRRVGALVVEPSATHGALVGGVRALGGPSRKLAR
ncbi:hypothetical protein B5F40_09160 [Gordonibacter sp. An230]|nr:hypothetical protein B5F40_09160 [Gordonibacter sp. An230]